MSLKELYFSVNMKLKIEFILFCGVHTLEKIWLSVVWPAPKITAFNPTDWNQICSFIISLDNGSIYTPFLSRHKYNDYTIHSLCSTKANIQNL